MIQQTAVIRTLRGWVLLLLLLLLLLVLFTKILFLFKKRPHIISDDSKFLFFENSVMQYLRTEDFCRSRGSQLLKNVQTFVKTDV